MDIHKPILKAGSKIALAAMGVLFVLGMICYKERVLFADASFVVFHIINEKNMFIQRFRYGSFITHLFPYLGEELHLPFRTLVIGYSISFYLFFLLVVAVLIYWLKQYGLAIIMALSCFLFVSESFMWVDELQQGIAWMFLLLGVTIYLGEKKANPALLILQFIGLAVITFFTHFVIIIPFCFLWGYLIIEKKSWPFSRNVSILLSILAVCAIVAKFTFTAGQNGAEAPQLQVLKHFSIKDIIKTYKNPVVQIFLYRCLVNYWAGVLVFVIGMVKLIKKKEKMLALWTLGSVIVYVVIIGLASYGNFDRNTPLFHIESEWSSIGIIAATPFVFAFLPQIKSSTAGWLLTVLFSVRLIYIICFLSPFHQRNEVKEEILGQMRHKGITKLALINDEHLKSVIIEDWGLPYESILTSELDGDKQQLTFLFVKATDTQTIDKLKHPKGFYDVWGVLPWSIMNKAYYNLDSINVYRVMTYDEFMK